MTAETVRIDQARETPVTARQRARFGYRYAYARSADSRASDDPGQDYLVLREDGVRLAFALCDGVGQSFYGDLAARLLGDALVDYLWEKHPANPEAFREGLAAFLDGLVEMASAQVAAHPLPEDLPPMVRQVLEEKRALGSESTFIAGLLDTEAGLLHLAWMGDSRLRLWGAAGEFTARLGDAFHTQERWSSRRGRVGELHTFSLPLAELRYLIAYSDGLARLDRGMTRHLRDNSIQAVIEDALLRPESDDIAFLEVWLGDRRPSERPPLKPPSEIRVDVQGGWVRLWWQPVAGVAFYEVRLDDGQSFTVYSPRHALELPAEALEPAARAVRVRGWDEEPGEWSREVALPEAVLPRPAPEAAAPPPPPPEAAAAFVPAPAPVPAPPPPTARRISPAISPFRARPGPPRPRPAVPPRSSWAVPLLAGLGGILIGGSLLALLILWPSSPIRGLLFPSPTPTATATATPTPTPTATFTPTPTPPPTATFTPTPTPPPTATAIPTPTLTPPPTTPTPTIPAALVSPTETPTPGVPLASTPEEATSSPMTSPTPP